MSSQRSEITVRKRYMHGNFAELLIDNFLIYPAWLSKPVHQGRAQKHRHCVPVDGRASSRGEFPCVDQRSAGFWRDSWSVCWWWSWEHYLGSQKWSERCWTSRHKGELLDVLHWTSATKFEGKSKRNFRENKTVLRRAHERFRTFSEDYQRPPRMFRRCGDHTPTTLNTIKGSTWHQHYIIDTANFTRVKCWLFSGLEILVRHRSLC